MSVEAPRFVEQSDLDNVINRHFSDWHAENLSNPSSLVNATEFA